MMLEKGFSWVYCLAALVVASQSAAQPESPEERGALERELALEQAASQRQRAAAERELAREQAALESEQAAIERELALEQEKLARQIAVFERELARERAALENERAVLEREWALEQAAFERDHAAHERQLADAREQLARAVGDVARASAQMRQPALRGVERDLRFLAGGRGVLGLNIEDTDLGVLVNGVTPNGPAAAAGVAVGDTIVSINDVELARAAGGRTPSAALLGQVGNVVPGDDVRLRVLRDGDYRDLVVEAGADRLRMPYVFGADKRSWPTAAWAQFRYSGAWNDVELVPLTPALGEYFGVDEGLLVVRAGSAAELGFRDGDVIVDLGGRKPVSAEHALRILASFEPGESLQAAIMRQRRREALAIRLPTAPAE